MSRFYPIAGTKELARYRECLTFTHNADGRVLLDNVHPRDHQATVQRLWAVYGRGMVQMTERRMRCDETYTEVMI